MTKDSSVRSGGLSKEHRDLWESCILAACFGAAQDRQAFVDGYTLQPLAKLATEGMSRRYEVGGVPICCSTARSLTSTKETPMSKDDSLRDLIERVEKATGPDRRLNADLLLALGWFGDKRGALDPKGNRVSTIPYYLGSLDAAMTLVPEGEFWKVGNDGEGADPSDYAAAVTYTWWPNGRKASPHMRTLRATAATPALALVAASLRAHMGTGG